MNQMIISYTNIEPIMQFTDTPKPSYLRSAQDPRTGNDNETWHNYMVIQHQGQVVAVPITSGNSWRGVSRRILADDLVRRLGWVKAELAPRLIHFLYNGGGLEENPEKAKDKEKKKDAKVVYRFLEKELRETIPFLDLLGVSYGSRMPQGLIRVGDIIPICKETAESLGLDVAEYMISASKLTAWKMGTKRDDTLVVKDSITEETDKKEKSKQMIYKMEYIIPNTDFRQRISWKVKPTALQQATLDFSISKWLERPYLGGKENLNAGLVKIKLDRELDTSAYETFMKENIKCICDFLTTHFS